MSDKTETPKQSTPLTVCLNKKCITCDGEMVIHDNTIYCNGEKVKTYSDYDLKNVKQISFGSPNFGFGISDKSNGVFAKVRIGSSTIKFGNSTMKPW